LAAARLTNAIESQTADIFAAVPAAKRYQDSLPWQELEQVRVVEFQPVLAITSLMPLMCVAAFTVVES
jgi:hypothetical protein